MNNLSNKPFKLKSDSEKEYTCDALIIATGALERPMIFNNNDRPGILLSSAIKRYTDFFGVACGEKNILFTNNDSAYETAISLTQKGINIEAIIDNREEVLKKILSKITGYDFVFIDCPPALGLLTINGLVASKSVIIPLRKSIRSGFLVVILGKPNNIKASAVLSETGVDEQIGMWLNIMYTEMTFLMDQSIMVLF